MKATTEHCIDTLSVRASLQKFLFENALCKESTAMGIWYINVGLEILSLEGKCLLWLNNSHLHVVSCVTRVASLNLGASSTCETFPLTSSTFLAAVSALFAEVKDNAKSRTFNSTQLTSPCLQPRGYLLQQSHVIGKLQPPLLTNPLYYLYCKMSLSGNSNTNARVEVRVPSQHMMTNLTNLTYGLIQYSLREFSLCSSHVIPCHSALSCCGLLFPLGIYSALGPCSSYLYCI